MNIFYVTAEIIMESLVLINYIKLQQIGTMKLKENKILAFCTFCKV